MSRRNRAFAALAAILAGLLPLAAYPPFGGADLAAYLQTIDRPTNAFPPSGDATICWIAWVPLLLLVRRTAPRRAFLWGWLAGSIHWLASLHWLLALAHNGGPFILVLLGEMALSVYLGLYWGLFAQADAFLHGLARDRPLPTTAAHLAEPFLWIGCDWLRSWLLTGFPWNLPAVALSPAHPLAQTAALGGAIAVAWPILTANGLVATLLDRFVHTLFRRPLPRSALQTLAPLAILLALQFYGLKHLRSVNRLYAQAPTTRIAYCQTNASCNPQRQAAELADRFENLLLQVRHVAVLPPDLVLWPESALFYALPQTYPNSLATRAATIAKAPLLTGCSLVEGPLFYNSAALFYPKDATYATIRHKRHLVPFGEYVPLDKVIPWLQRLVPTGASCSPGRDSTPIELPLKDKPSLHLAPLICYEDIYSTLARDAARHQANILVNLSNDNWFDGSCEPRLHLAQSAYRAVETGLPLLRVCNGGVSAVVTPAGKATPCTSDGIRLEGFAASGVWTVPYLPTPPRTVYSRFGNWICAIPAAILLLATLICSWRHPLSPPERE
ncbi:MAG: apolipoprotein N-acyltransferase [Kiritimatiellia bacterium]